jgi:hypothetical protein
MNRTLRLAAAAVAAGLVLAPVAQAQEQLPNTPENRAVAAAKQGPEQLRHFIQRTRSAYGLHFEDFRRYLP